MAAKGDKARLYDIAFRMFTADHKDLTEISAILGVSRQTLSQWKADTLVPGDDRDEWDKGREMKRSSVQRLKVLFERELKFLEDATTGALPPGNLDGISKLGALVQRWEAAEREAAVKGTAQRAALFLDFIRDLIEFGSHQDADLVRAVEANFDDLVNWGRGKYSGDK